MASNIISPQKKAAIKKSYESGLTVAEIVKKHKTARETLRKMVKEGNWQRPENYNPWKPKTDLQETQEQLDFLDDIDGEAKADIDYNDRITPVKPPRLRGAYKLNTDYIKKSAEKTLDQHSYGDKTPKEMYEELGWDIEKISEVTGKPRYVLWGWKTLYGWQRKNNNWRNQDQGVSNDDSNSTIVVAKSDDVSPKSRSSVRNVVSNQEREYQQKVSDFKNFIGEKELPFQPKDSVNPLTERKVWLVEGDVHIPYQNKAVFKQILDDFFQKFKNEKFHGLVINGDFMDGYDMNSYGRDDNHTKLKEELAEARVILSYLSSIFDEIIVVDDNHIQGRQDRYREQQLLPSLSFTMRDINDMLVEGFPNVRRAKKTYKNGEELGWFTKIGEDCIAGHYEAGGTSLMATPMKFSDWVDNWGHELGLGNIRLIINGHTHKGGEYILPGRDRKIIEGGCVVSPKAVKYAMKPNAKGSKPPVLGATYVVQENGRSLLNECRFMQY